MVIGIGIDMVRLRRFEAAMARHGERFLNRLFTPAERERFRTHPFAERHLAARFAAKEAAFKALGTGWGQGVAWREVEIVGGGRRPAALVFSGRAREAAARRGIRQMQVSLSHDGDYALALVIATDEV
ncbi:MAG: holo-ACP synthase [Candidatus Methylomirabilis sp.]